MEAITARQLAVVDFILDFSGANGFPPTRSEIASWFGFKSPNAAEEHLRALERKGVLTIAKGTARGINVIRSVLAQYRATFDPLTGA